MALAEPLVCHSPLVHCRHFRKMLAKTSSGFVSAVKAFGGAKSWRRGGAGGFVDAVGDVVAGRVGQGETRNGVDENGNGRSGSSENIAVLGNSSNNTDNDNDNDFALSPRLRNASMPHVESYGMSELGLDGVVDWQKVRPSGSDWAVQQSDNQPQHDEASAGTPHSENLDRSDRDDQASHSTLASHASPNPDAVSLEDETALAVVEEGRTTSYTETVV
jgi:hypothetical protein